jgi:hypothetical protein
VVLGTVLLAACATSTTEAADPAGTPPSVGAAIAAPRVASSPTLAAETTVAAAPPSTAPPAALSAAAPSPVTTQSAAALEAPTIAATGSLESLVDEPRAAAALALIDFPWRRVLPGWSIAFLRERSGLRGLTKVDDRRIEIFVRDGDTPESLARIIAHELGHAVDVELNSPADRERWRAARGVGPEVSWWPGNGESDFDTLAGDFAEAMATLLTGWVSQSRVAPPPGPTELALLSELLRGR